MLNDTDAVAYMRVSTQNQVDQGDGLEIQRRKIIELCVEKGLALTKFYEDRAISGAVRDRPELIKLLDDCEKGKVKKIVVYKQDRLSRELTVALWLETQFKKNNIEVLSVIDPEYDMEDPLQKAFKRIADVFAELERDTIARRMKDGRINSAKNGKRGSGPIPFGYMKVGNELKQNPGEAECVRKIFHWFLKGHRYSEIVEILKRRGITTKRGRPFQIQSIKAILSNGTYCGDMTFGDISSKGVHESIVSRRAFLKSKAKM